MYFKPNLLFHACIQEANHSAQLISQDDLRVEFSRNGGAMGGAGAVPGASITNSTKRTFTALPVVGGSSGATTVR